jgi:uncharacterized lipoprotein NlpE involved in copper resistance
MRRIWSLTAAMAVVLVACGGGDDDSVSAVPDIVVEGVADEESAAAPATVVDDATDSAGDSATDSATDEEIALDFVECMRDEGIDMDDPTVAADGSVTLTPPGGQGNPQPDGTEAAFEECSDRLDGASFLPTDDQFTEIEDQLLEVAQCLRDEGLDVDDPDFSGGAGPGLNPFGPNFDPNDPANQDAIAVCQSLFTGINPGGQ